MSRFSGKHLHGNESAIARSEARSGFQSDAKNGYAAPVDRGATGMRAASHRRRFSLALETAPEISIG
jgi:hypothetical protein